MDPISVALVKSGIPAAIKSATEFLNKLLGPASEEVGLLLGERARTFRLRNMLKTLGKTQEMLKNASIEPKSVELRVLIPLLDGASLEDNESLSVKWAALLANATISGQAANISQIFSNILSQLSPTDALILDNMKLQSFSFGTSGETTEPFSFRGQIMESVSLKDEEYAFSIDNLRRLGLCIIDPPFFQGGVVNGKEFDMRQIRRDVIVITELGLQFMRVCSEPAS